MILQIYLKNILKGKKDIRSGKILKLDTIS